MKKFSILILIVYLAGCTVIDGLGYKLEENGFGNEYALTQDAFDNVGSCLFVWGIIFPPSLIISIPSFAIDLTLSAAVDTILLPIDFSDRN